MIVPVSVFWSLKSQKLTMIFWHHNMNIFGTRLKKEQQRIPLQKRRRKNLNQGQDLDPKKDRARIKSIFLKIYWNFFFFFNFRDKKSKKSRNKTKSKKNKKKEKKEKEESSSDTESQSSESSRFISKIKLRREFFLFFSGKERVNQSQREKKLMKWFY